MLDKWAKQEAARQRRVNKTPPKPRYRKETPEEERRGLGSYWAGYDKGREIGIDPQMDKAKQRVIG